MKSKTVIICVDDEMTILDSLKIELKTTLEDKYLIETAEGGEEALELIEELIRENYDIALVISDYIMTGMKGDELLKKVHGILPKTLKILLTGQADLEAVSNAIKYARLYRYISKPWQIEDLRLTVKEAVHTYFLEQQLQEQNWKLHQLNEELETLVEQRTHELRLSEEKFARAFHSSPNPITIIRRIDQRLIEANDAFYKITGYSYDEVISQQFHTLECWIKSKEKNSVDTIFNSQNLQNYELDLRHKSGEIKTLLLSSDQMEIGGASCIICVGQDISELKRAQMALSESEKKYRHLVETSQDIIWSTDSQGYITFINQATKNILGYEPHELIGHHFSEFLSRENLSQVSGKCPQIIPGVNAYDYEEILQTKEGKKVDFVIHSLVIRDGEGIPIAITGTATDITTRKQTELAWKEAKEAADRANKAKSEFLANMSHELRTPLNAILGFTQLMSHGSSLSKEYQEYVRIISHSGEHLLDLINEVLELSKIEAGKLIFHENEFNLYNLLRSLEEMFILKAKSQDLDLHMIIGEGVPQSIKTDEGKLRQILINLLGNAIKFTEKGQILLRIKLLDSEGVQSPGNPGQFLWLEFEIEDTGIGIESSQIERIFEPFVQVESAQQIQSGTGLGLPLSRKFVEMMGGNIFVKSQVGKGSTFTFDIQVKSVQNPLISSPQFSRRVIGLEPGQPSYRILVVEDHWESRQLLVRLLSQIGFQVQEAENGEIGVNIWENWEPHLIWMDMRMPVMDGYEASQIIRRSLKGQSTIIIALTASAWIEKDHWILASGCNDFVRKPFREDILLSKMAEYLGVKYHYEETVISPPRKMLTMDDKLLRQSLQEISEEWLILFHNAALAADDKLLGRLLEQITPEFPKLAESLNNYIKEFRFDKITDITEKMICYEST